MQCFSSVTCERVGTEGAGTGVQQTQRGGAGLLATTLGVVRPWELTASSTPTSP